MRSGGLASRLHAGEALPPATYYESCGPASSGMRPMSVPVPEDATAGNEIHFPEAEVNEPAAGSTLSGRLRRVPTVVAGRTPGAGRGPPGQPGKTWFWGVQRPVNRGGGRG